MTSSTNRRAAAVLGAGGALFVALAAATVNPLWAAAGAINLIGAADSLRQHYRAGRPGPRLVRVDCPHCGAAFAIDPGLETLAQAPPLGPPVPGATAAFRPACPACWERVPVRA